MKADPEIRTAVRGANHRKLYQAWLAGLSPAARDRHEAGAARAAEAQDVHVDIQHQYVGPVQKVAACALCGTEVSHCLVQGRWRVSGEHETPCGLICFMDPRASHFGGEIARSLPAEEVHAGGHCTKCFRRERPGLLILKKGAPRKVRLTEPEE